MAGTRLHLVRHGHTAALGRSLTGRSPGISLSVQGREQAAQVARHLAAGPAIARVFSSPRLRARETAGHIAGATGCVVEEEARLDEVDFGAWSGCSFGDLDTSPGWADWNRLRSLAPTPGGETMLQVQARAIAFVQYLREQGNGRDAVLVSHADVIKSILAYLLGMPIDLMQRIEISPAGRSIVVLDDSVRIEAMNLPASG